MTDERRTDRRYNLTVKDCQRRRCLHEQPKWIMNNLLSCLCCTKQTTTNKTRFDLTTTFCRVHETTDSTKVVIPNLEDESNIVHTHMFTVEHKHIPQMSLGVSLFTTCGIYFQSTRRPEPNSLFSKKHSIHCVQEAKIKTQSCRRAFPGLSDLVWITLQWEKTAKWSYSLYKKR